MSDTELFFFELGVFIGILFSILAYQIAVTLNSCIGFFCGRGGRNYINGSIMVVSGDLNSSVVQQNGRTWIDGQEVGTGQNISVPCMRSLRITADGKVLDQCLQPGTPIYIRVEPGVVFEKLDVGYDLHLTGNIEGNGSINVGDDLTIHGSATSRSITVDDNLTITGQVTCDHIKAGDDITINGDVYCDSLDAGDDVTISGRCKRRGSLYKNTQS